MKRKAPPSCGCLAKISSQSAYCLCSTNRLLQVLGRRYALSILNIVANSGKIRFQDLKERLEKASSSTLAMRLAELEKSGLLVRTAYPQIPPRVEYSLTSHGVALREKLMEIQDSVTPEIR